MSFRLTFFFLITIAGMNVLQGCAKAKPKETHALIHTDYGDIRIVLYNSTPKHRDNFIKLAKEGYYDGLLFHRVIEHFMIQGGDPNSRNAEPGTRLGTGGPGYLIDAEIGAPHIRGALAAARTPNPEKKSSGCQFYIVTGNRITGADLDVIEKSRHFKYNDVQRKLYMEQGGTPSLDLDYTVFGEVESGMDVADKISQVEKDANNRPVQDVKMTIKIID